ncbi:hypothetical protein VNO77_41142 [Canavalia gladiata]|uniref:Uncharacterized protein n=1 Tax=Canavalia gladiata TaxID=3824 RepID=A0AAN9JYC3_CANGL
MDHLLRSNVSLLSSKEGTRKVICIVMRLLMLLFLLLNFSLLKVPMVKHVLIAISFILVSVDDFLCCTVSDNRLVKIYDAVNFDMMVMIRFHMPLVLLKDSRLMSIWVIGICKLPDMVFSQMELRANFLYHHIGYFMVGQEAHYLAEVQKGMQVVQVLCMQQLYIISIMY